MKQHQSSHFEYEFFGPYGPALLVLALPCVVLGLVSACNSEGCLQLSLSLSDILPSIPGFPSDQPLYSHEAMAAVVGWFCAVLLLHVVLPGDTAQGVLLPSGRRLTYKLNGKELQAGKAAACTDPAAHHPDHPYISAC
jgi:lamin-B receptor